MATVVWRSTAWYQNMSSWPAGVQVGDFAVNFTTRRRLRTSNWNAIGTVYRWTPDNQGPWSISASYTQVTAAMLSQPPPNFIGFLVVLRDTLGIGQVRLGTDNAPARVGGGVLTVSSSPSSGASPALPGTTWYPPTYPEHIFVRPYPGATFTTSVTTNWLVGWSPAGSNGNYGSKAMAGATVMHIEVLPGAGPSAPAILSPGRGDEIASTEDIDFQWQHAPSIPGGFQNAYRLRFDASGSWVYWNASTSSLVSAETINSSSVQGVTIHASKFAAMVPWGWEVSTREGIDGKWSPYSSAGSFTPVTPPSVNVNSLGPVHNDLTPTITWTSTTPRGVQTAYRVQIINTVTAAVVHDTHAQPGADQTWTSPVLDWVNGGSYEARVQVQQTGGSWSPWVSTPVVVTWDTPATPTLTATPASTGIVLTVNSALPVVVERISPEGLWEPLLPLTTPEGGQVIKVDVFAPTGTPTAYRAFAVNLLDGQSLTSDWGMSAPVTNYDPKTYIASARDPLHTWLPLDIHNEETVWEHYEKTAVSYGMDDPYGRVDYGGFQGRVGQFIIHTHSQRGAGLLLDLFRTHEPMLVKFYPQQERGECNWGTGELLTIMRSEPIPEAMVLATLQDREFTLDWIEHPTVLLGNPSTAPQTGCQIIESTPGHYTVIPNI